MRNKIYQIDAFTDTVFSGNPAAVCPLEFWPEDSLLQKIALENNLSETAFYVKSDEEYEIRWFTPTCEVDLCGHATLATAYVLFNFENHKGTAIAFRSKSSGYLKVTLSGRLLTLDFPSDNLSKVELTQSLKSCFNLVPDEVYQGKTDYMLVYRNEKEILNIIPDFISIGKTDCRGIIVTAPGENCDFVSRFFGPQSGVDEDPVTGSAHTTLTPYWSGRLKKNELSAIQLSARRGILKCKNSGSRTEISGTCRLYMIGELFLELN
jgi:PhzF family phenazine biosynthesis protein